MKESKNTGDTFRLWIDEVGILELAGELKIHPMTVRHWRDKFCYPRVPVIRKIKKLSRGRVTYEAIIDRPLKRKIYPKGNFGE